MQIVLILILALFGYPDLPVDIRIRLENVIEGTDTRDEGFAALVDYVSSWGQEIRLSENLERNSLLSNPSSFRGRIVPIEGVVEQTSVLGGPWNGIHEWFIRDKAGLINVLYVLNGNEISRGDFIALPACFYKTMALEGRDRQTRLYPTFLTNMEVIQVAASPQRSIGLILLFISFGFILLFCIQHFLIKGKTKKRRSIKVKSHDVLSAVEDAHSGLSEDPAAALAELYDDGEKTL